MYLLYSVYHIIIQNRSVQELMKQKEELTKLRDSQMDEITGVRTAINYSHYYK